MNKNLLLLVLLFSTPNLFGAYQIKIAVYRDHANLKANISKIPGGSYRKNILIAKKNDLHYVTSTLYDSEGEVKKALNAYKKVFPDAFVTEVKQKVVVSVPTKVVEPKKVVPVLPEAVAKTPEPIENQKPIALDAKMLLENKTVYICTEGESESTKKQVVKLDFKEDYVVYSKLKRDIPPIHIPYTFDQDCVILPISGINFKYKIYKEDQDFLFAQSFIDDKKGHKLRYYFDEELALEFAKHK